MMILTIQQFKDNNAVFANNQQQDAKIEKALDKAERVLKTVICTDLYAKILSELSSPTTEISDLLIHVEPFVSAVAYRDYLPYADIHSTATGFRTFSDENSQGIGDKRMQVMISSADSDIEWYKAGLINFLEKNANDYPEYRDSGCRQQVQRNYRSSISSAGQKRYETNDVNGLNNRNYDTTKYKHR